MSDAVLFLVTGGALIFLAVLSFFMHYRLQLRRCTGRERVTLFGFRLINR